MTLFSRLTWLLCLTALFFAPSAFATDPPRWAVYYGSTLPSEDFLPYDVIVFDADSHPALRPLLNRSKVILGYISFGEAEDYRGFFPMLKKQGMLLHENPNWKGHFVVDLRNPQWTKYIIEELIPPIIHEGFDGIFIDTIDSAIQLEIDNPKAYAGMMEAATRLIYAVRMHYPNLKIMLNRGFELLPNVAPTVDMVLAESILMDYDSKKKKAIHFPDTEYLPIVEQLKAAQTKAPNLKIFTLDYWPPSGKDGRWNTKDADEVKRIYATQREHGFIPYVSTPALDALFVEPTWQGPHE